MTRFYRDGDDTFVRASLMELLVIQQQAFEITDRFQTAADELGTGSDDPFWLWERSLADVEANELGDLVDREPDPAERRLFPPAYPGDPVASADFRRYTEADLRRGKVREADVVLGAIEAAINACVAGQPTWVDGRLDPEQETSLVVADRDLDAWLKTLNTARLLLATQLGIETAADADALDGLDPPGDDDQPGDDQPGDDDPRHLLGFVYDLLTGWQTLLLSVATGLDVDEA